MGFITVVMKSITTVMKSITNEIDFISFVPGLKSFVINLKAIEINFITVVIEFITVVIEFITFVIGFITPQTDAMHGVRKTATGKAFRKRETPFHQAVEGGRGSGKGRAGRYRAISPLLFGAFRGDNSCFRSFLPFFSHFLPLSLSFIFLPPYICPIVRIVAEEDMKQ
jgi:hypothetical protein